MEEILLRLREKNPLVHCINNYVTANDCANLLLACGASAIMADDPGEMEDIAAICDGHVFNLGTPNPRRIEAMMLAGRAANRAGRPLVLDPVGVGSTQLRRNAACMLLDELDFAAIRGNAGEIACLARGEAALRGVDADLQVQAGMQDAVLLARRTGAVVVITGREDMLTDGRRCVRVYNGHPLMGRVTGAGCMLSALMGACMAADPERKLEAALAAVCAMGICGEWAGRRMAGPDGNASFRNHMIDAMYRLRPEDIKEEAKYAFQ